MHRLSTLALVAVVAVAVALAGCSQPPAPVRTGPDAKRGEYLVRQVGLCGDCHSPRDQTGQFVASAWLAGAPVGFTNTVPMPAWATEAMPIAGLPTFPTDEEAVQFLMTGKLAGQRQARPPMPEYRLNRVDAEDVVAYLRSLAPHR